MKALLLFSGGIDSTYLLHKLQHEVEQPRKRGTSVGEVICLSFDYQQPHADRELEAAKAITEKLGVLHLVESLSLPFMSQDMASDAVVPNRNMIFLAVAGAVAVRHECDMIYIGCTQSDHEVFADCRPSFIREMNEALRLSVGVHVVAPLVGCSKRQVVVAGEQYGIDWGDTWSCYAGGQEECGECLACEERVACLS